mmetsp:Transcript_25261/g.28011  ORF Transcript_25261/g.28011 Transcript_25261/m.28011 type:complete len:174 (+) Transcript_25261:940-1461(+)
MTIGLVILGLGAAFTIIPIIPEMLDSVEGKYLESRSEVSDKFSGIFNIAGGFGQIVGPSAAGALEEQVGFNMTFDIIGIVVLSYAILYMLFCDGFRSIGRSLKATVLRFKKSSESDTTNPVSPSRKLLEETSDDEEESDNKNNTNYAGEINGSYASTDASFNNNAGTYAINQE